MPTDPASALGEGDTQLLLRASLPQSYVNFIGRKLMRFLLTLQGLGAFLLITLGVLVGKFRVARSVIYPLVLSHANRAGLRLLPMVLFLATALGLVVIGQTVSLLTRVRVSDVLLGKVMVTVVVREWWSG